MFSSLGTVLHAPRAGEKQTLLEESLHCSFGKNPPGFFCQGGESWIKTPF